MANQSGKSGRGSDSQQQGRQAAPVVPEGERIGQWSEEDEDEGLEAAQRGSSQSSGGHDAPWQGGGREQADSGKQADSESKGSSAGKSGPGSPGSNSR